MFKIFTNVQIIYDFQAKKIKQTGKEMGFNLSIYMYMYVYIFKTCQRRIKAGNFNHA